jgi:uncharacterized protein (DUF427 family)
LHAAVSKRLHAIIDAVGNGTLVAESQASHSVQYEIQQYFILTKDVVAVRLLECSPGHQECYRGQCQGHHWH